MTSIQHMTVPVAFAVLLGASALQAGPIDPSGHPHPEQAMLAHEAEHEVDRAWEIYHRAALGGTIASPVMQMEIEQHLHEARTLVAEAQQAAERGDHNRVKQLVDDAHAHASRAIEQSKETKP